MSSKADSIILGVSKTLPLLLLVGFCFSVGLLFGYSPRTGFIIFTVIGLFTFIFYKPHLGILIALFAIPFDRLGKITPEGTLTVAKVFILFTMLAWLIKALLSKDDRLAAYPFHNAIGILGIAFLVISFVSGMNATNKALWLFQQLRRTNIVLLYLLLILTIEDKQLLKKALWATLIGTALVTLTGIYEMVYHTPVLSLVGIKIDPHITELGEYRLVGPAGDPDFHNVLMIFGTAITMLVLFRSKSLYGKTLLSIVFVLFAINVFGSGSRAGLLGFLISILVFGAMVKARWKWAIALGAGSMVVIGALLTFLTFSSAPLGRYTGETGTKTFYFRLGWMNMSFSMIKEHPIIGVGTGNFLDIYNRHIDPRVPKHPQLPSNSFLHIWAENGAIGFLIYLGLFLAAGRNLIVSYRLTEDPELQMIAAALLGALAGLCFFSVTANTLENENYWILFAYSTILYIICKKENELGPAFDTIPD